MSDLSEKPEDVTAREGLELVTPGPRELFIDLDSVDAVMQFNKLLGVARTALYNTGVQLIDVKRTTSRNGGTHAYLLFSRDLTDVERVTWQACLGSDPMRELLSLLRIELNLPIVPTCFFEKPETDPLPF